MKSILIGMLLTVAASAQTQYPLSRYVETPKPMVTLDTYVSMTLIFVSGDVSLVPTQGGGLKVKQSGVLVAEVKPDGTVSGDHVRALRLLAAAMADLQNSYGVKSESLEKPTAAK